MKKNKRFVKLGILLVSLIFICSLCNAQNLQRPSDWVSDYAGVIDPGAKQKISSVISELEQKTTAEIAVVTIKKLENNTIEQYAVELFSKWGIGKKGKDNGVLLLAAIEDRKLRIEVGYGLEGVLPDGLCGEIRDRYILPYFKTGEFGKGMAYGTIAIAAYIAKDAGVELAGGISVPARRPQGKPSLLKIIFRIIFFICMIILFIRHPFLFLLFLGMGGRGGGGGGFSGGFGGFGGGMSGGGGASGSW